jgi:hypothetical protein
MKLAQAKARRATARGKLPPPPPTPMAPKPPAPATRSAAAADDEEAVDGAVPVPPEAVNISLPLIAAGPSRWVVWLAHWLPRSLPSLRSVPRLVQSSVASFAVCWIGTSGWLVFACCLPVPGGVGCIASCILSAWATLPVAVGARCTAVRLRGVRWQRARFTRALTGTRWRV